MRRGFLFLLAAGMIMFSACSSEAPLIPREVLFGNPEKAQPQISPDGKSLAWIAPRDGVLNLWVSTLGHQDALPVTRDRNRGIRSYFWSPDSTALLYLQDRDGNENTHLYAVDLKTLDIRNLTPFEGVRVQILKSDPTHPQTILIAMNKRNPKVYDVYRLQWRAGALESVAENDGHVSSWIEDADLNVRGKIVSNISGGYELYVRDTEQAEWRAVASWGVEDSFTTQAFDFSKDGKSIYLIDSRNSPAGKLVKLSLVSGQSEVLAEDAESDVVNVMMQPETRKIQAAIFLKEKTKRVIFDSEVREDFSMMEKIYGSDFVVVSRDRHDLRWIVRTESDRASAAYFLYDRKTKNSTFLFENQPKLKKYKLAEMKPVSFKARDGLVLHGYLTMPIERSAQKPPLVLKVHGGPWSRDIWGYDPRTQWLANRGYACLQINFRGSTTYGKAFLNAGDHEWGGKMQDDLTDAVQWAIQQGYADPKKIAIFGASYGGYAALAGAAFTPDLYRVAVAVVGPSNLLTFIRSTPPYWSTELAVIQRRVGHPEKDEALLKARSPLFAADKIRIPMLIAQGANDPRVKKAESDQIVEALKQHGIQHEYLLFPDEGHGFAKPENQMKFTRVAEEFLAKNLGGKFEK